jgi:ABC-type dipeptide/oligopeptide/nickel transport system ATPase component
MNQPALQVSNLSVEFATWGGVVKAVRDVSFTLQKGRTLAIVGESGCGKSVTVQSLWV